MKIAEQLSLEVYPVTFFFISVDMIPLQGHPATSSITGTTFKQWNYLLQQPTDYYSIEGNPNI